MNTIEKDGEKDGDILVMPSFIPSTGVVAVKIVNLFKKNRAAGLPFIQGLVIVSDADNGTPLAIMDGAALTAIRTGAATGVATDVLARKDARTVAVFGAGVQARTQLAAVCTVRKIESVKVIDHLPEAAAFFAEEATRNLAIPVTVASSAQDALDGADIVCAATTSQSPIFDDADLKPGTHLNAIGSFRPEVQEICEETVVRAKIVTDLKEMALAETGDLIIPIKKGLMTAEDIHGDLGDILSGDLIGRENDEEVTFFKSVGLAIQDLAAGARVIRNAKSWGLGTEFRF
jgi:ornithine cyclodeaminase/alanine dehydrogenase-like protein (mu-crystallin family)